MLYRLYMLYILLLSKIVILIYTFIRYSDIDISYIIACILTACVAQLAKASDI